MSDQVRRLPGRIVPGLEHGLVWDHGIALLEGTLSAKQAIACWEEVREVRDLTRFFAALATASGLGLLELPGFAVALHDSTGTAFLATRGSFTAEVVTADGAPSTVSGQGVSTWSERRVEAVAQVHLLSPQALADREQHQAAPGEQEVVQWPVTAGCTPAAAVVAVLIVAAGVAPAARSESIPEPEIVDALPDEVPDEVREVEPEPAHDPEPDPEPEPEPEPAPKVLQSPVVQIWPEQAPGATSDPGAHPEPDRRGEFDGLWGDLTVHVPPEEAAVRVVETREAAAESVGAGEATMDPLAEPDPEALAGEIPDPGAPSAGESTWSEVDASPETGFIGWVPSNEINNETSDPPGEDPSSAGPIPVAQAGDHDGHTVLSVPQPDDFDDVAVGRPAGSAAASGHATVLALVCPTGHGNPPQRPACRLCGAPLAGRATQMARPSLGRLTSSTGESFELTSTVVVGRNPRAARFQGTDVPRLLAIPQAHVSSSHLEIRLEGWNVLAIDLKSTNGTFLRRHSDPPVRLPETPQLLRSDDMLDLGHGVHLTFTGLP